LTGLVQHSLKLLGIRTGDAVPPGEEVTQRVIGEGTTLTQLLDYAQWLAIGCLLVVAAHLLPRDHRVSRSRSFRSAVKPLELHLYLVGAAGFEPATSSVSANYRERLC